MHLLRATWHVPFVFRDLWRLNCFLSPCSFGFGRSLIKRVRQADRVFEEAMIWNYADQISAGLQHMHARRIMHRCALFLKRVALPDGCGATKK